MSTLREMNDWRAKRPEMTKEIARELVACLEAGEHRDRVAKSYYGDNWGNLRAKLISLGYCGDYLTRITKHCCMKRAVLKIEEPETISYLSASHVPDRWLDLLKKHHKSYHVGAKLDDQ